MQFACSDIDDLGCFGDEEEDIRFNGEIPDDGVADLKFVLEDAEGCGALQNKR